MLASGKLVQQKGTIHVFLVVGDARLRGSPRHDEEVRLHGKEPLHRLEPDRQQLHNHELSNELCKLNSFFRHIVQK